MDLVTLAVANALGGNGGGGSSLPTNPAQDGTYALQNTVSSGTSTLSWASGGSSGGGVLVVHRNVDTLDKTWQQIHDALLSGGAVLALSDQSVQAISFAGYIDLGGGTYLVEAGNTSFVTAEADGYPVAEGDA